MRSAHSPGRPLSTSRQLLALRVEVAGALANDNHTKVDIRKQAFPMGAVDVRTNAFPMGDVNALTHIFP